MEGMTNDLAPPPPPSRPSLPWPVILGLASLALLWPLTALWGLEQGAPRALTLLGLTAAVWIGVVGIGRIRRPVLTLTVTGLLHGALLLVIGGLLAGGGGPSLDPLHLVMLLPALVRDAGIGALLGLVALGVQRVLGPRHGATVPAGGES